MQITVRLFATFRRGRFDSEVRDVPDGITVGKIVEDIRLPKRMIGIILVNSRHVEKSQELFDGDTLAIFPFVGGG